MTRDEHQKATILFDRLRDLKESDQAAALDAACAGSPEMRAQIEALLAADRKASGGAFLEGRAVQDVARLLDPKAVPPPAAGLVIGNYQLGARIGSGGMGVVYEGLDLRLKRKVAVKLLPAMTGEDGAERVLRFEREARAASLLNHPNIVSIFDADVFDDSYYIATEFIEGKTLRQLLVQSPRGLASQTILDIVTQAASALTAAHDAGIVHRDIKPENIMLRPDGFVKVLDFGLAKLLEAPDAESKGMPDLLTKPGHVAGTIQYLSPEQITGKPADSRSDLFSLGVVAYELATGTRPFDGPTDGAVYEALLNRTPAAPSSIRPDLGIGIDALILRMIDKDPDLRFQTARDFRSACKRLVRESSQPDLPPVVVNIRKPWPGWKLVSVATAVGAIAVAGWFYHGKLAPSQPVPARFERLTDSPGEESFPSLSSDGKQFVYASARSGNWDIYLQRTGGSTSVNLTRDCAEDDTQPALSPDDSRIVFRSERDGGGLMLMEATGENPRRINSRGYMPAWAPDGHRVVYSTGSFETPGMRPQGPFSLYILDLDDNSERQLETGDALQPSWSPHGLRVAYWGVSAGGRRDIFSVGVEDHARPIEITADTAVDWSPVWDPSGQRLYFLSDRGGTMNIWHIAIDERSGLVLGHPEPATVPAESVGNLAIAGDGKSLIYSQSSKRINLGRLAFDPVRRVVTGPPEPLADEHTVVSFSFSPDGKQIVYDALGDSPEDLWIMNADGSGRRRITTDSHRNRSPYWSPAGDEIVFFSDRGGQYDEWVIRPDGSGLRPLTRNSNPQMQNALWSPDGKTVLAGRYGRPVMLDAKAVAPVADPPAPPGLRDVRGIFFNSWTKGPDGSLIVCDLLLGPTAPEVVIYAPEQGTVEHTGVSGRSSAWLKGVGNADTHRYFIFSRKAECLLYDRKLKTETRLFSVFPSPIITLDLPPDGRYVYFSATIHDADLWLAHLDR